MSALLGSRPPVGSFAVSNSEFLRALAFAAPKGSSLWVAGFIGNPDQAGGNWAGAPYNAARMAALVDGTWCQQNTYFSVAALVPDDDGELARRKTNFARLCSLVADDAPIEDLQGAPSWVLLTSPGKRQIGLLLEPDDPDCENLALVTRLVTVMAERGLIGADRSGNNAVRYVRLPVGQNQKPRESGHFAHVVERWAPGARYTLEDAAAIFGIDLDELRGETVAPAGASAAAVAEGAGQDDRLRTLTANILRGEQLHDSINMAAASMVASGMAGGAAVNLLRSLMEMSQAPHDERWRARYDDIPRSVATAQQKYAPAVSIQLLQQPIGPEDDATEAAPDEAQSVPPHLMTVPGVLGLAVAWINSTARKPQPLFAVQAALALGSTVMGRRYCTNNGNWPMLYLLNVGASGSGKEHAKYAVETLLESANLGQLIGVGRFASESGVVSSLIEKPAQFSVLDEFGKMLQGAAVAQNFADRNTLKALMEVWGRADGVLRPVAYSTAGMSSKQAEELSRRVVRKPSLTLLAMTTPETLFGGLTSAAVADGFLNRIITVHSDHGRQLARPVESSPAPQDLLDWMVRANAGGATGNLGNLPVAHDMEPTPTVIPFDAGALATFRAFEEAAHSRMDELDGEGLAEMLTRATEMAMRLALIVAVSCEHSSVQRQDAQWACDYVHCHGERNLVHLRDKLSDGPFDQLCKAVLATARAAREKGVTERDLNRGSAVWRAAPLRTRDDALKALDRRGELQLVEVRADSGRGRKRIAWVCRQFIVGNSRELLASPHDANKP